MSHGSVTKKGERLVKTEGAKLKFHGSMADFGTISAPAGTPARMIRSVLPRYPELITRLRHGEYKVYIGRKKIGLEVDETSLHIMVPAGTTVHFVPVARGSKGRGASLGKTIAGAVLAIGAVATAGALAPAGIPFFGANGALAGGMFGVSYGAVATFGAFTMLGGISGLLGGKTNNSNTGKDASTALSGVSNNMAQGGCIPLVYGRRVRVGSLQASLSYSAQDWGDTSDTPSDNPSDFEDDNTPTNAGEQGSFDDLKGKSGTGSKSGKGGSAGSEAPNNLRSKSIVKIVDIVGQGPGVELVDGAKSIFFNGTPLMASDGTYNFYGVKATWKNGSPDQTPLTGVPSATDAVTVNTKVANGSPVTQTITSETATSASVVINIPALYSTNKKSGVLENGRDVGILVEVRASGNSQWSPVVSDVLKNKKCTSPYQCTYTFDLPEASGQITQWDVRVTRTTPDDTEVGYASDFYFQYLNVISDYLLVYPDVAYCYLEIDSSAFGDSTPTRTYDVTGKEVRVPANYDPVARTYSTSGTGTENGTWDGITWKIAKAVDDPCWCTLDLVNSDDFGMNVSASKLAMLESDLYEASQYACVMVDDYYGGTEPRYSLNVCINSPGDAFKVLGQFTSSFRAMPYWTAGSVAVSTDMPRSPSMIVTNANVLDGDFSYEGTALSGRHNVAYCSYTNNESGTVYTDVEPYEDQQSVAQFGPRIATVDGFGVSSRGLALRLAHWLVDTELHQTQTVTYQCGIDHAAIRPGEIIEIADHWYQGARQGGRVQPGSTAQVIQLDGTIEIEDALTYTLKCLDIDGQPMAATIESITTVTPPDGSNAYSVVTLSNPYPSAPVAETLWAMTEPTKYTLPQWRVINIKDKGDNLYEVTALFHDPAKFDRVENNLPFNEKIYSQLPNLLPSPLPAPTNVSAQDYTVGEGTTTIIRTDVGWTSNYDARILGYNVRAVSQDTGATYIYDAKSDTQYEIDGLAAGTWTFGVRAYGKNGTYSPWVDSQPTLIDGKPNAPDSVLGLTAIGQTRAVSLTWTASAIRNLLHYEVQRAPVQNGVVGTFSTVTLIAATSYIDSQSDVLLPTTTWAYQVRAVDTYGTLGVWSNVVQATTTYLLVDDLGEAIANTAKFAQALYNSVDQPKVVEGDQLPSTAGYPDKSVINFNGVLYQNKGGTWQRMVGVVTIDNDGNLTSDQLGDIESAKVVTSLTQAQIDLLKDAQNATGLTDDQRAQIAQAISSGQAAQDILNVVSNIGYSNAELSLEQYENLNLSTIAGQITSDQVQSIAAAKVAGQLTNDQLQSITATKITEKLTSSQISTITTAQLTGKIVANQIDTVLATQISGTITSDQIQSLLATKIAGTISSDQIASIDSSKLTGQIVSDQIKSLNANLVQGQLTLDNIPTIDASKISSVSAVNITGQLTASQIASLNAAQVTGQITNTQISDGAISTPKISAGAIVTASLAAGAITAEKLAIGSPSNQLANSTFDTASGGLAGWLGGYSYGASPNVPYALYPTNATGFSYGWLCVPNNGTLPKDTGIVYYARRVPVSSNSRYCLSARVGCTVLRASVEVWFYDKSGTNVGYFTSSYQTGADWSVIGNMVVVYGFGTAPSTATTAEVRIVAYNASGSDQANGPGCAFTYLIFGQVSENVTQPPIWTSGAGTSIDGGQVITGSIVANKIAANSITSAQIAANTITSVEIAAGTITGNNIAGNTITGSNIVGATITADKLTANSIGVREMTAYSITTGQIAAGAVNADRLVAYSITAAQLAANSVTTAALSAGSVVAGTIAAGAVTVEKLAVGSPNNMLTNTTFDPSGAGGVGWSPITQGPVAYSLIPSTASGGFDYAWFNSLNSSVWPNTAGMGAESVRVPCEAGLRYGASIRSSGSPTISVRAELWFFDGSGNLKASYTGNLVSGGAWSTLDQMSKSIVIATAPSGATQMAVHIWGWNTSGSDSSGGTGYAVTQVQLCALPVNATTLPDWVPGGVTTLDGSSIGTGTLSAIKIIGKSITAAQIAAGTITTSEIAAGTITTNNLAANCITTNQLAAGSVNADIIQSGAVVTRTLAAGAVTADILAANSVTAGKISVGAVLAQNIAAGAVTTASLAVASPNNQIANSTFDTAGANTAGWPGGYSYGASSSSLALYPTNANGFSYGWLCVPSGGTLPKDTGIVYYARRVPVSSKARYCVSARVGCTSLRASIEVWFYNSAGSNVGYLTSNYQTGSDWSLIGNMVQVYGFGTAPNDATTAEVRIVAYNSTGADVTGGPGVAFTNIMFGQVAANVTEAPIWTSGAGTSIDGGQIITGSISANKITSYSITGTQIAGGTITGTNIAGGTITGGLIAAGTITGGNIAGGTITGDRIAGATIVASNLAAGAITTEKLAVGSTSNMVANSVFDTSGPGTTGWTSYSYGSSASSISPVIASDSYTGFSFGSLYCAGNAAFPSTTGLAASYNNIPVGGNKRFQFSARVGGTDGGALKYWLEIYFIDKNGNYLSGGATNQVGGADWSQIANMNYVYGFITSPANTVRAELRFIAYNPTSSNSNTNLIGTVTQVQLCEVPVNASQPAGWSPGTSTSIDGGNIKTATIYAAKLIAATITADKIAVGTITATQIAGATIQGYNIAGNTITGDKLTVNCITAANIQAGAIGADQIAAGAIKAKNLAGDTLIVSSAQIGNLVVGTSNMQDSSITTYGYAEYGLGGGNFTIYCAQACSAMVSAYGYVDAISDGSVIRSVTIQVTANGSNGINSMTVNGTRGTGTLAFPVNLSQGNNTIQLTFTYTGTSSNYQGATRIMVLGRYK